MNMRISMVMVVLFAGFLRAGEAQEIVAKFPVKNAAEESALGGRLLKLGPAGLKELCGLVQPLGAGEDAPARFAVSAVVRQVWK